MEQGPGDSAHVVRFSPFSPAGVLKSARKEKLLKDHYGVSVWATTAREGESVRDVVRRLLKTAQLGGISDPSRYALCAPAGELTNRGFQFTKDRYAKEEPEHYCVVFSDEPDDDDAQRFLEAFKRQERWKEDDDAA